MTSLSDQAASSSQFKDLICLRSVIILLQTLPFNSKLYFQLRFCDTCTNRSTRDLNASFSRFVETDTTLDTVMHDLAHDLVHPDRQDKHKIRNCMRQSLTNERECLLLFSPSAITGCISLVTRQSISYVASEDAHSPAKV